MAFREAQSSTLAGTQITYFAATVTTGDTFQADPKHILLVRNAHTASITATIQTPGLILGEQIPDLVRTIVNATDKTIGPFAEPGYFNDPVTGLTTVIWSVVTNITFAVIRVAA
jgi:hypothetical protein